VNKTVFEYPDYKSYLLDWAEEKGRGEKSRIAAALRCHMAYISQVLNGSADLSLEQAETLNAYLGHAEEESDFFLLLVLHGRAGTASLRDYHARKIARTLEERRILKNRLKFKKTLPIEDQAIFFSAWYYSAIHLLLQIPEFQTKEKIAAYLKLPLNQVKQVLDFLESLGLATQTHGRYKTGEINIYLAGDSPMIARHHTNWRMRAINAIDRNDPSELHYSSVVSIAKKDATKAHAIMTKAIEQVRALVGESSPEDSLFCYCLDLFEV
jgi:uncharacterized protein (TIGR02147 family)